MAKFETKFSIGDNVYVATSTYCGEEFPCSPCGATGCVTLEGERYLCPKCKGAGRKTYDKYKYAVGVDVVGKIACEVTEDGPVQTNYMLRGTGIGTGTLWAEHRVFDTREGAQAACDRMNEVAQ